MSINMIETTENAVINTVYLLGNKNIKRETAGIRVSIYLYISLKYTNQNLLIRYIQSHLELSPQACWFSF